MKMQQKKDFKTLTLTILPMTFSWLFIASIVLIYIFDLLDYINMTGTIPNVSIIPLIAIIGTPIAISILLVGIFIDKRPDQLGNITSLGLFGCSLFLALDAIALIIKNGILFLLFSSILGVFMAILTVSSHVYYGSSIKWNQR